MNKNACQLKADRTQTGLGDLDTRILPTYYEDVPAYRKQTF